MLCSAVRHNGRASYHNVIRHVAGMFIDYGAFAADAARFDAATRRFAAAFRF